MLCLRVAPPMSCSPSPWRCSRTWSRREFCFTMDQALLALARDERVGSLAVADPWRSYVAAAVRRRSLSMTTNATVGGRAVLCTCATAPYAQSRSDRRTVVEREYREYGSLLGRALARARNDGEPSARSVALVTFNPFVAAFCDEPWIRKIIYFGFDDWATGEGVRPWWTGYRDAYRRIDERVAHIFVISEELAGRISDRAVVVPNGVDPADGGRVTPRRAASRNCRAPVRSTREASATSSTPTWSSARRPLSLPSSSSGTTRTRPWRNGSGRSTTSIPSTASAGVSSRRRCRHVTSA